MEEVAIDIKKAKRVARDLEELKLQGFDKLAMSLGYMQGLNAAIKVYEQQAQAANQ